ncbi:MAG: RHS repeat-associated core domain-containing protein [Gammaproteobacteria bacterium]|nr:RHS repeat-associated core domain-containing protein [Gammaproteobacteria bacterium]MDE0272850.1 RHS repeat-associated core domain-containing protein [Gammaproteobacteria bacterium]
MSFAAWGVRRDPDDWTGLAEAAARSFDDCATRRGFTGHEMLDAVGAIHMNGRIYDPHLGRFLRADPFVQFPANLQSHNRYSYALNNPLSYTDPSGHFIFTLAGAFYAAAAKLGFTATVATLAAAGFGDALLHGASFQQALQAGFISGVTAGAFHGAGGLLGTHFGGTFAAGLSANGFALKVLVHGAVGGITSALGGGRFGHGFASGGFTALGSGLNNSRFVGGLGFSPLRVAIGAAIGGTASRITGGKFANGAITGAFSQALNQERQEEVRQSILDEIRQAVEDPPPFDREEDVAFFLHERLHLISELHGIEIGASTPSIR